MEADKGQFQNIFEIQNNILNRNFFIRILFWKVFQSEKHEKCLKSPKIFLQTTTCACGQLESEAYRRRRYSK